MSDELIYYGKYSLDKPVLIAGWTGMGNVALQAVDYLRVRTGAKLAAEIDISNLINPDSVNVESGLVNMPVLSRNLFYISEENGLILFESESQISGKAGTVLLERILDLACDFGVETIFTGAAFPLPLSHNEPSAVYLVANDKDLRESLTDKYSLKLMNGGQISGLNGLLLGYALKRNIKAACLLATLPIYAVNFPNPKASMEVLKTFQKILGFSVDMGDLERAVKEMEIQMEIIEKKMKNYVQSGDELVHEENIVDNDEEEKTDLDDTFIDGVRINGIPSSAILRIEKLFKNAAKDRQVALKLKEELDRWNLFKFYEDRFLDLFKEKH
ncbi:MAG: PAC2 family protein [Candidatus Theseobacter exili]|nr:PAC2 family protein [Candidatus Theseobacter exili]